MSYESPEDFLKSLLDDKDQKKLIECISKGKEPDEILEEIVGD